MKKLTIIVLAGALLVGMVSATWANTTTYNVKANVLSTSSLSVTISRVPAAGGSWQRVSEVDFGTLYLDSTHQIYRSNFYYVVDVGVNSNVPNWTVRHQPFSVRLSDGSANLDNKINVDFVKQSSDASGTTLLEVSFGNSDRTFTKAELLGGWLRIYYGLATGSGDNSGVVVIPADQKPGQYTGSVTITLTS